MTAGIEPSRALDEPKRLLVTVRNGKTGMRVANTLEGAVALATPDDEPS